MFGYHGKILKIDLTKQEIKQEVFTEEYARKYLGGNGFVARLIYDNVPLNCDPLSAENAIVFATGPLNETPVWGTGRGHLGSLSPQTGYFADSNFGGNFASNLKKTGFDAIFINGAADAPVYITVENENVSIKDASHLWGLDTEETHEKLIETESQDIESACIGPAGENKVVFASIMCSGRRISAAGRGGLGSVMGAKNLKAICANGNKKVDIFNKEDLRPYLKELYKSVKEKSAVLTKLGTPFLVDMINSKGMLGTHNNNKEVFEKAPSIGGDFIEENFAKKNIACKGCPVACGKKIKLSKGTYKDRTVKMAEYETIYAMGSMLDNGDIESVFNGNTACDLMGMDTISFGVSVAFLAECFEKEIINEQDLGLRIDFGDGVNLSDLAIMTAKQEGIGRYIARGSERMAREFGKDSYKYLYAIKGLEMAGHSARGVRNMGLAYSTSTRGGSHHDARAIYNEPNGDPGFDAAPEYTVKSQHHTAIGDSLVMCRFLHERAFTNILTQPLVQVMKYVTGWDMSLEELNEIGARIYNLERYMNCSRGVDRSKDMLPYRIMNEPIPDGPAKGRYVSADELNTMLDKYYELRGWDSNGRPTKDTLQALQIID